MDIMTLWLLEHYPEHENSGEEEMAEELEEELLMEGFDSSHRLTDSVAAFLGL